MNPINGGKRGMDYNFRRKMAYHFLSDIKQLLTSLKPVQNFLRQ
jgi:hypothetical protein